MPNLTIRGLPSSLANDALWFAQTADQPNQTTTPSQNATVFGPLSVLATLLLIALADFLFWHHPIGLSLIIFSAGLSAAALTNLRPSFEHRDWLLFAGAWLVSAFPVLEFMQTISVLILILGHLSLLIWSAKRSFSSALARTLLFLPQTFVVFAVKNSLHLGRDLIQNTPTVTQSAITAWVLPLMVGLIFMLLFIGANPVFQEWTNDLLNLDMSPDAFTRATFWSVTGILVLPFVLFKRYASELLSRTGQRQFTVKREGTLINVRSVQNSLILFNGMFLLQNVTDMMVLWGETGLPEGMTYATYAHSGAYPLMATSILAVLFALISRRFTYGSYLIKALLLIWIAQNVMLLGSALFRLDLYIAAYGLTYLRLRATIGMFLVLAVMLMMIWQLWKAKSNQWLSGSCALVVTVVFYTCSFVNFGHVIASENLSRDDQSRDTYYLCRATRSGIKAIYENYGETGEKLCVHKFKSTKFLSDNWRSWSYRAARLERYRETYLQAVVDQQHQSSDSRSTNPYETPERSRVE